MLVDARDFEPGLRFGDGLSDAGRLQGEKPDQKKGAESEVIPARSG